MSEPSDGPWTVAEPASAGDTGVLVAAEEPTTAAETSGATPAPAERPRWFLRRVPRLVWAITALHISLMAMASLIYPPFMGYDEGWHVDMVWSYYHADGLYGPGERHVDRGVDVANSMVPFPSRTDGYAQAPIPPLGDRESFDAMDDGQPPRTERPNQMVQHPPLYYVVEAALLRAVPGSGGMPFDQQVWLLRLFSILMVAPLPLLAWATARRLVGDGIIPLTAAALTVTLPGLTRVGGSVNNDNLLVLLGAGLLLVLARVVTGDLRRRTAVAIGVLATLALLTKGFALALPLTIAAAYGVAWLRQGRRALLPFGIAAAVTAVEGGGWWLRNLIVYGAVQPIGIGPFWNARETGPERPGGTVGQYIPGFFQRLTERFWGGHGLFDYPKLPVWVSYAWLLTVTALMIVGICYGIGRSWGRLGAAIFALPAVSFLGIIFYGALDPYLFNLRWPGIQGRYLYAGLTGIAVLAALGAARLTGRWAKWLPLVVLTAGVLTHAWAWRSLLDSWWAPHRNGDGAVAQLREALGGVLRWSPWPRPVTMLPFALVAVCAVAVLALAAWQVRSPAGTLATVSAVGAGDAAGPTIAEPAAEPPLPEPSPGPESADQRR